MSARRIGAMMAVTLLLAWGMGGSGCSSAMKLKVREPLQLSPSMAPNAQQYTSQGASAYLDGQYDQAKALFAQAVSAAPNSGEAHYNLGLALFKLGDSDAARDQFMQAANLAPGNKIIWDSPALSSYGSPEPSIQKKAVDPYSRSRGGPGGGLGGAGGGAR
jgi:tetratricopeptide (TPR) repeat protein